MDARKRPVSGTALYLFASNSGVVWGPQRHEVVRLVSIAMQNAQGIQPVEERAAGAANTELVTADPIQKLALIDYQWSPKGGADWKLVIIGRDDCHVWRVTVKRDFYEHQSSARAEIGLPGGGWIEQYTMDGSAFWHWTGHTVHVSEAEPHARQVAAELLAIALRTLV